MDASGAIYGQGVVVSPSRVLTCGHVLDSSNYLRYDGGSIPIEDCKVEVHPILDLAIVDVPVFFSAYAQVVSLRQDQSNGTIYIKYQPGDSMLLGGGVCKVATIDRVCGPVYLNGQHKLTTVEGYSGAGIFDDLGRLVGIHSHGGNVTNSYQFLGSKTREFVQKNIVPQSPYQYRQLGADHHSNSYEFHCQGARPYNEHALQVALELQPFVKDQYHLVLCYYAGSGVSVRARFVDYVPPTARFLDGKALYHVHNPAPSRPHGSYSKDVADFLGPQETSEILSRFGLSQECCTPENQWKNACTYLRDAPVLSPLDQNIFNDMLPAVEQYFGRVMGGSRVYTFEQALLYVDSQSDPGYPWNLRWPTKGMVLADPVGMALVRRKVEELLANPVYWMARWKSEVRRREKIVAGSCRVFVVGPIEHFIASVMLFGEQNQRLYDEGARQLPSWCLFPGASLFHGGWHRLAQRMLGNVDPLNLVAALLERLFNGTDATKFDQSIAAYFLYAVKRMRQGWSSMNASDRELCDNVYRHTVESLIVLARGYIIQKAGGQPSGCYNTAADNSIVQFMLIFFAWQKSPCGRLDDPARALGEMVFILCLIIYGDDMIFRIPKFVQPYFKMEHVVASFLLHGVVILPEHAEPVSLLECKFLSHHFRFPGKESYGLVVPAPDPNKGLASLLLTGEVSPSLQVERACMLMISQFWNRETSNRILDFIHYEIRRYGLDYGNFPMFFSAKQIKQLYLGLESSAAVSSEVISHIMWMAGIGTEHNLGDRGLGNIPATIARELHTPQSAGPLHTVTTGGTHTRARLPPGTWAAENEAQLASQEANRASARHVRRPGVVERVVDAAQNAAGRVAVAGAHALDALGGRGTARAAMEASDALMRRMSGPRPGQHSQTEHERHSGRSARAAIESFRANEHAGHVPVSVNFANNNRGMDEFGVAAVHVPLRAPAPSTVDGARNTATTHAVHPHPGPPKGPNKRSRKRLVQQVAAGRVGPWSQQVVHKAEALVKRAARTGGRNGPNAGPRHVPGTRGRLSMGQYQRVVAGPMSKHNGAGGMARASQSISKDGSRVTIRGRDYLSPLVVKDLATNELGKVLLNYQFNPSNQQLVQLNQWSNLFQKFQYKKFVLHFRTTQSSFASGSINVLYDSDPIDVDGSGIGLLQQAATTFQAHEVNNRNSGRWLYNAKREAGGEYYIFPDNSSNAGVRQTVQAHVAIFIVTPFALATGAIAYPYTLGSVDVEYEIELYHRQVVPASLQPTLGGFARFIAESSSVAANVYAGKFASRAVTANWSSYVSAITPSTTQKAVDGVASNTTNVLDIRMNAGTFLVCLHNHAAFGSSTNSTFTQVLTHTVAAYGPNATLLNSPFGDPINASSRLKLALSAPTTGVNVFEQVDPTTFAPPTAIYALVKVTGTLSGLQFTFYNNSAATALYTTPAADAELTSILVVPVTFGNPPTLKQMDDIRFEKMEKRIAELQKRQELSTGDNFVVVRASDSRAPLKNRDPDFVDVGAGGGARFRDPSPGARRGAPVASPAPPGYVAVPLNLRKTEDD